MTTEEQKNELLNDFKNYLEQSHPQPFAIDEQPDLNTLLSELSGLKTEVKTESRQFKTTLDTLDSALSSVQESNKTLTAELTAYSQRFEQQQNELVRNMLLEVVDIYDRLSTGLGMLENYRPVTSLFKSSRKKDIHFIQRFKDGQGMTVKRFEQLLQRYHVTTIECTGKIFDPLTMSAIETGTDSTFDNGIVLEELRKGFLFKNQVLRLAEVKVNKTS